MPRKSSTKKFAAPASLTSAPQLISKKTKRNDSPLKGVAAFGVVAILLGLTIGGYIASRYFRASDPNSQPSPEIIQTLAEELANKIVTERETPNPLDRQGYVEAVAVDAQGSESGEAPAPSFMRYTNGYYGMTFVYPVAWTFNPEVQVQNERTHIGAFAADKLELKVAAVEFSEATFSRAVEAFFTKPEKVTADIEAKQAEYAQLHQGEEPLVIDPDSIAVGHERRKIDGHDAFVDWYAPPVINGEPRVIRWQFWINGGRGLLYHFAFILPVEDATFEDGILLPKPNESGMNQGYGGWGG
ncbi:hypothetical protein HYV72_00125 [Candidatus Uhrbacteria bacterium]|nr:hypothetical protein [Candidatus Uhrbacteria bacterium]